MSPMRHEPFVRAWRTIFPRLFQPLSAMPAGLSQHVRVPEGMFNTISEVYRSYHMTDPTTFYQKRGHVGYRHRNLQRCQRAGLHRRRWKPTTS